MSEDLSSDPEYSDSSEWTESSEPGEGEGSYEEPPVESDQSSEETDNTGEVTE